MSIWAVLIAYVGFAWLELGRSRSAPIRPQARWLWSAGAACLLLHAFFAFDAFYEWSHQVALATTAEQTADLVGVERGEGLYLNYLMVVLWLGDATWLRLSETSYRKRSPWIGYVLHTFMVFMMINGMIIFASGPIRWVGVAVFALLGVKAIDVWRRSTKSRG